MKEKISCSLDGDIVNLIDDVIDLAPYISTRSAFIEMATIFITIPMLTHEMPEEECNQYMQMLQSLYEKRCEWNAKTKSENGNI